MEIIKKIRLNNKTILLFMSLVVLLLTVMSILLFTTETGKMIVENYLKGEKNNKNNNGPKVKVSGKNHQIIINNITINNKKQEKKLNNYFLKRIEKDNILELFENKHIDSNTDRKISLMMPDEKLKNAMLIQRQFMEEYKGFLIMKGHTPRVIKVGVENVDSEHFDNIHYKKEFLLANLDKVNQELTDSFLDEIGKKNTKEFYAKQMMLKSISNYIYFNKDKAIKSYSKAKQIYPTLPIIKELSKAYKDIAVQELKYAYVLVSSVIKNKNNMDRTADKIIGLGNAKKLRELEYNLYLNVNQSEIRVHTIIEHFNKKDLDDKIMAISGLVKSPLPFRVDSKYPKEYNLNETRNKIFIVDSSQRKNDKTFAKKLKLLKFKNVYPKGSWKKSFGIYAIYYDGNSYDKNDLDKLINSTRDIIGSYVVYAYAYQQSTGKTIHKMFTEDETLKYLIILEKNALIKDNNKR